TIQDIETCRNSSYLSWKCLLKFKDVIIIIKSSIAQERDPQIQKDSRRLNKIISTDLLGGSTYSTIGFMNPIIALLKKQTKNAWLMEINTEELVDLTNEDTVLDDIGFVDDYKEDENEQPKK
ncbi:9766_t:CDS:2, partial [Gigaspora rosea]